MNASQENSWRAAADKLAIWLSKNMSTMIILYLLGCLLMYFGITNAMLDLLTTHTWKLRPEHNLVRSLVNAAVTVIMPFITVWITGMVLILPAGIALGAYYCGRAIVRFFKGQKNRD